MDLALLMFRSGIRSVKKTLVDGNEHELFYKARTPAQLAHYFGAEAAFTNDADGAEARHKHRAKFIAESMCTETGEPLMTVAQAELIPGTLKSEILAIVLAGSNDIGDAGKG